MTVQSILNKHKLGTRYDRWLALEQRLAEHAIELTAEQVAFLEGENPQFAQRHVESSRPGELLNQDTFFVGTLKGVGKVWLHAVVDTYSSYAFGFLFASKQPEAAVAVLHNDVLPFYERLGITIGAILTDNGLEFCGTETHPYEVYCSLNDIEHRTTKVRSPRTNGFVERFNRTVLDEFFRKAFRQTFYESVEQLQADLDRWLLEYNTERPHQGYRNINGSVPTLMAFVLLLQYSRQVLNKLATFVSGKRTKPWMKQREIDVIVGILRSLKPEKCLEWGSGYSTLFFPRYLADSASWVSVEHVQDWWRKIRDSVRRPGVEVYLVEPDNPDWTDPNRDGSYEELRSYIEFPKGFALFDFILVEKGKTGLHSTSL